MGAISLEERLSWVATGRNTTPPPPPRLVASLESNQRPQKKITSPVRRAPHVVKHFHGRVVRQRQAETAQAMRLYCGSSFQVRQLWCSTPSLGLRLMYARPWMEFGARPLCHLPFRLRLPVSLHHAGLRDA